MLTIWLPTCQDALVYLGRLTVAIGPQMNVDKPIVNRTPALEALMMTAVVPKSSAIWSAAENNDVLLKHADSVAKEVVKTTKHFCAVELSYPGDQSSSCIEDGVGGCFSDRGVWFSRSCWVGNAMMLVLARMRHDQGLPGTRAYICDPVAGDVFCYAEEWILIFATAISLACRTLYG